MSSSPIKNLFLSFYLVLPGIIVYSQSDSLLIQNSKPIDDTRYKDVDGSPYYFSDWVIGSVLRSDGKTVENVLLNYNGNSHEMEIKSGNAVHILDRRWHLRVDVSLEQNAKLADEFPVPNLIFQRGAHRELADRYSTILFLGDKYMLIKDYDVGKVQKEFNDVGKNIEIQRFKEQSVYYLKKDGALTVLKLQRKRVVEAFGEDGRVTEFIDTQKLDIQDEADLVRLVEYADKLK